MKTLASKISTEAAATQSAWVELYDIYLPSSISTPWGSTNVIRLCTLGETFSFFTPTISPESTGTQGNAASYYPWPIKREMVKAANDSANDTLRITASNVTAEWATMLATVDWHNVAVVIRKTSQNISSPASTDCVVVFSGLVDSAAVSNEAVSLTVSSDMALLSRIIPSENMHASCRFKFGDDQCTIVPWTTANHREGVAVAASSSTTLVKYSAGSMLDTLADGYGTDEVDALSNGAITASSQKTGLSGAACSASALSNHIFVTNDLSNGDRVQFAASVMPGGLVAATWYYVKGRSSTNFYLSATPGGPTIDITSSGTSVTITSEFGHEAYNVKSSNGGHWAFLTDADWGTATNAYYYIPDAQAGLKNAALKPYIQFDFGSAKALGMWRFKNVAEVQPEERVRLLAIFSSSDASTWAFEGYFEMPNQGGVLFDCYLPNATSKRYWRVCVRSRWAESLYYSMFAEVRAYAGVANYWRDGYLKFRSNTATVALRSLRRRIVRSYTGGLVVPTLPATPSTSDVFDIWRGCARTFNACAERGNVENYGGFNDLPTQTVIR